MYVGVLPQVLSACFCEASLIDLELTLSSLDGVYSVTGIRQALPTEPGLQTCVTTLDLLQEF